MKKAHIIHVESQSLSPTTHCIASNSTSYSLLTSAAQSRSSMTMHIFTRARESRMAARRLKVGESTSPRPSSTSTNSSNTAWGGDGRHGAQWVGTEEEG